MEDWNGIIGTGVAALAVATTWMGFVLRSVNIARARVDAELEALRKQDADLTGKIQVVSHELAGQYLKRQEFLNAMREMREGFTTAMREMRQDFNSSLTSQTRLIEGLFSRLEQRIDGKADKP